MPLSLSSLCFLSPIWTVSQQVINTQPETLSIRCSVSGQCWFLLSAQCLVLQHLRASCLHSPWHVSATVSLSRCHATLVEVEKAQQRNKITELLQAFYIQFFQILEYIVWILLLLCRFSQPFKMFFFFTRRR